MSNNKKSPYHHIRSDIVQLLATGEVFTSGEAQPTRYSYAEAVLELGERNPDVVVLDADVSKSIRTHNFAKRFPERS